jgi:hypothetical protein
MFAGRALLLLAPALDCPMMRFTLELMGIE